MKLTKTSLAALLALSFAGAASAQTVVYIAGAPATRQTDTTAIYNTLIANSGANKIWVVADANVATSGTLQTVGNQAPSKYYSANHVNFYGGLDGSGNPITVKVSYNGSTASVQSLAAVGSGTSFPQPFLPDSDYTSTQNNFALPTSGAATDNEQPVIGVGDTFQATTPWYGYNYLATGTVQVNYKTLNDYVVGAVPYVFIASKNAPAGLNNITTDTAANLYSNGPLPLSYFTSNSGDSGTTVYGIGRDTGSGARFIALTVLGLDPSTPLYQYNPTVSSGSISATPTLYPAEIVNGEPLAEGDGGYSSFTPEGTAIEAGSSVGPFIGYFNTFDANSVYTASGNTQVPLTYNGVSAGTPPFANNGTAPATVANGAYPFWSYEHVLDGGLTSGPAYNFEIKLKNDLTNTDATILLGNLNVGRYGYDGGQVEAGAQY
jgi:hypothetical protein